MTNIEEKRIDYHYTECGLNNVLITGMPVKIDDDGDEIMSIPCINLLHALITVELVEKDGAWSASELKFVRSELGLTQSQLGELVDKDRQTVARWEKDQSDIDNNAEIIIRLAANDHLSVLGVLSDGQVNKRLPVKKMSEKVKPGHSSHQIVIRSTGGSYERAPIAA